MSVAAKATRLKVESIETRFGGLWHWTILPLMSGDGLSP